MYEKIPIYLDSHINQKENLMYIYSKMRSRIEILINFETEVKDQCIDHTINWWKLKEEESHTSPLDRISANFLNFWFHIPSELWWKSHFFCHNSNKRKKSQNFEFRWKFVIISMKIGIFVAIPMVCEIMKFNKTLKLLS